MAKEKIIVPPLSNGYMLSSMLGFLISAFFVPQYSLPWAVAFCTVFAIMFLSAMKTMTFADANMYVALEKKKDKKEKARLKK